MSAEMLRRAAALMRERAEAATPGPWIDAFQSVTVDTGRCGGGGCGLGYGHEPGCSLDLLAQASAQDTTHIASWHPTVALAVADWLDAYAGQCGFLRVEPNDYALTAARAYLGDSDS